MMEMELSQDTNEAAEKVLGMFETPKNNKGKRGGPVVRTPIGKRAKVCEYALQNGVDKALRTYPNVTESSIYMWLDQYRKGLYDDVPPDALAVPKKYKVAKSHDVALLRKEIETLHTTNKRLIDKLYELARQ